MNFSLTFVSCIAAVVSTVAALRSRKSEKQSVRTAEDMRRIEQDRRHSELTPEFLFEVSSGGGYDKVLFMKLEDQKILAQLKT
ncbi:MAG: hypothetical protein WDO06_02365 [Actinomycetota bacterium]